MIYFKMCHFLIRFWPTSLETSRQPPMIESVCTNTHHSRSLTTNRSSPWSKNRLIFCPTLAEFTFSEVDCNLLSRDNLIHLFRSLTRVNPETFFLTIPLVPNCGQFSFADRDKNKSRHTVYSKIGTLPILCITFIAKFSTTAPILDRWIVISAVVREGEHGQSNFENGS